MRVIPQKKHSPKLRSSGLAEEITVIDHDDLKPEVALDRREVENSEKSPLIKEEKTIENY